MGLPAPTLWALRSLGGIAGSRIGEAALLGRGGPPYSEPAGTYSQGTGWSSLPRRLSELRPGLHAALALTAVSSPHLFTI